MELQAVESLCAQGGHFAKISNAYVAGFFKPRDLAMDQPNNIEGIELPTDMGVTPELEAKILEKRGDILAILQLIREEEPDLLEKWETGQPSPSRAGDGDE